MTSAGLVGFQLEIALVAEGGGVAGLQALAGERHGAAQHLQPGVAAGGDFARQCLVGASSAR